MLPFTNASVVHASRLLPIAVLIVASLFVAIIAEARIPRSAAAVAEFKRENPCPATGRIQRVCPGYIVDHITPLCAGGLDRPSNMQWQLKADSLRKDRVEVAYCNCINRKGKSNCPFNPKEF